MTRLLRFFAMTFAVLTLMAACPPQPTGGAGARAPQPGGINLPESRTGWATFTNRNVNVRSQPGSGSALLGSLPKNTVVDVYGTNSGWTLVRLDTGGRGWVFSKYLGRRAVAAAKPKVVKKKKKVVRKKKPAATPAATPTPTPTPDVIVGGCEGANCGGAVAGGAVPGE